MKSFKLILITLFFIASNAVDAQVSVNVNIGSPPTWGPAGNSQVEYYYLPDIESYYDVRQSQFIYFGSNKWVYSKHLPARHRNYNLHNGYKVVLTDYHGRTPYSHFKTHKSKYYKGYKGKPQKNRRSQHDHHGHHDHHEHNKKENHGKGHGKKN